ncbi:hypothetical protein ACFXAF_12415 [Kitasatospora sp. NPDC059463]|uniref:hypothetical protein n=1 Tax=unclassified Kitasatospora TaxID=2633591 RepID=UPI0036C07135
MSGFPSSITHAQKLAAVRALGLDPLLVKDIAFDATEGVLVTVFVRDSKGRIIVQGRDQAAEATLVIPYADEPPVRRHVGTYGDPAATIPGE